jgi:tRNA modification GTPase
MKYWSLFLKAQLYTGENTIEISCLVLRISNSRSAAASGCRMADPRVHPARFLNGKLDLSQAEAVADLISSDNAASHQTAMQQMRGGFLTR